MVLNKVHTSILNSFPHCDLQKKKKTSPSQAQQEKLLQVSEVRKSFLKPLLLSLFGEHECSNLSVQQVHAGSACTCWTKSSHPELPSFNQYLEDWQVSCQFWGELRPQKVQTKKNPDWCVCYIIFFLATIGFIPCNNFLSFNSLILASFHIVIGI